MKKGVDALRMGASARRQCAKILLDTEDRVTSADWTLCYTIEPVMVMSHLSSNCKSSPVQDVWIDEKI